jgi:dCMP deaminase
MEIAESVSKESYATRLKVGAVIVKDDRGIAHGYNGTISGASNECEHLVGDEMKTKDEVIHAEMNALMFVARSTSSSQGTTLYCTHAPCVNCAKHLIQAGIVAVVYKNSYKNTDGIDLFIRSGVSVHQHTEERKE